MSSASARVMLWCAPRSTSNLFAKCLTAIEGNEVWIEPYQYAFFALHEMQRLGLTDPGVPKPISYDGNEKLFEQAAGGMSAFFGSEIKPHRLPYDTVKNSLENSSSRHIFVKDMGVAMQSDSHRKYLPAGFKHTFLIRHPYLAYRSYRKAIYRQLVAIGQLNGDKDLDESGFAIDAPTSGPNVDGFFVQNHAFWRYVRDNIDPCPIVVDSSDLLQNPARIISRYCEAVGLPYSESLLTWEATAESYQGWKLAGDNIIDNAENFVGALLNTTGFLPPSEIPSRDQLTDDVLRVSDAVMSCYEEMYATRIT